MQLNLSGNQLCGVLHIFVLHDREGTYTAEGITAIADALHVNGALTALDLSSNYLKDEGVSAVCKAIQSNKETKLASLHFSYNDIGTVGANAVAAMVAVTGGVTALDLSFNDLNDDGVSAVCEAIQSNKETKLASLNFRNNGIGLVGSKSVAAMVAVTGGLTSLDLSGNQLCGLDFNGRGTYTAEGITAIADALRINGGLTSLNLSSNLIGGYWDHEQETNVFTPEGPKAIADALLVNGALTSVELRGNKLGDEGWGAIFAAICGSKDSKIMSLVASSENISPAGGKLIAEALRMSVTGGLTSIDLSWNQLEEKGTKAICEALKQNKTLKELDLSKRAAGAKHVAKMLGVNSALTKLRCVSPRS